MKKSVMLITAIMAVGCNQWDLSELHRIADWSEDVIDSTDRRYWTEDTFVHDTILRFAAVEAEEGYDWRRDTVGGVFHGSLTLFRNFNPVLTLALGPEYEISPDCATHYIIGEHLYTYYSAGGTSVVKCDGRDVMRAEGLERLKGLLPTDDGILTLSTDASGHNFFVRMDGRTVMKFQADAVFGSMTDDSYPLTGALYEDGGNHYFCYRDTVAGEPAYYIVENLKICALTPPSCLIGNEIKDIKYCNGEVCYFVTDPDNRAGLYRSGSLMIFSTRTGLEKYYDGRVLYGSDPTVAYGYYTGSSGRYGRTLFFPVEKAKHFSYLNDGVIIPGEGDVRGLIEENLNGYMITFPKTGRWLQIGLKCYFFSHRCGASLGEYATVAFTPHTQGLRPYIWMDGDTVSVDIKNGYLSVLTLADSVTTIPGGFHPELVLQ